MLKAILIFILLCLCADNLAFDGYYQFIILAEAKDLYRHFTALGWSGLFFS